MDNFTEDLYRDCQKAINRTNPRGEQKHNFAWNTDRWFAWKIERTVAHPLTGKNNFSITESVEFILGGDARAFYKVCAYTTGIKGRKNHVRTFDFDLGSEEDLVKLNVPLLTLLRTRKDPLYGSLSRIRVDKEIADLHEQVIKAVLEPVEREEVHTDISDYDETILKDEKTISSLRERPLISKMEEDLAPTQPEEKIPYWKTIDPEHPQNEIERRAFEIVDETCRDPEYAKVSKR
jgi:hypothetical protein